MSYKLKLLSIAELMEKQFFIPSYQRGYRWGTQQVSDLLNDFYSFALKKKDESKEFYCLQPIVVKENSWTDSFNKKVDGWEVVDGQQRLTTIRILLAYLVKEHLGGSSLKDRYKLDHYHLHYETRYGAETLLANIHNIEGKQEDIDEHHMVQAYSTIRKWFGDQESPFDACDSVLRTLMFTKEKAKAEGVVQIIWYELGKSENAMDSFVRINLGKIPLTNAELVKALVLQKANFGSKTNDTARLRQLEIAGKWDTIENSLQQPLFWAFLTSTSTTAKSSRIELLLDLLRVIAEDNDKSLQKIIGTDQHATFRYFYHLMGSGQSYSKLEEIWTQIHDCFSKLQEWFNNPKWYHYIGFLIAGNEVSLKSVYCALSDVKIRTKTDATKWLVDRIASEFKELRWKDINDGEAPILDITYSTNAKKIKRLLLLFNVETSVRQTTTKALHFKFPFDTFKSIEPGWDVEHIDSATENTLRKADDQKEWMQNALTDLDEELNANQNLMSRVIHFVDNQQSEEFQGLYNEILLVAGESDAHDDVVKDSLGNLALLDSGTNRAYGNALFTTKRRKIIQKDKVGAFIPICTRNVFLKYYNENANRQSKWSIEDMRCYQSAIYNTLANFLPPFPNKKSI